VYVRLGIRVRGEGVRGRGCALTVRIIHRVGERRRGGRGGGGYATYALASTSRAYSYRSGAKPALEDRDTRDPRRDGALRDVELQAVCREGGAEGERHEAEVAVRGEGGAGGEELGKLGAAVEECADFKDDAACGG
jgi:hypothetical protein